MTETARYHFTIGAEVDLVALDALREELDSKGELDRFPGQPTEWRSMLDLSDLVDEGIIVRSEVVDVTDGPPPWKPPPAPKRSLLRRLVRIGRSS